MKVLLPHVSFHIIHHKRNHTLSKNATKPSIHENISFDTFLAINQTHTTRPFTLYSKLVTLNPVAQSLLQRLGETAFSIPEPLHSQLSKLLLKLL